MRLVNSLAQTDALHFYYCKMSLAAAQKVDFCHLDLDGSKLAKSFCTPFTELLMLLPTCVKKQTVNLII